MDHATRLYLLGTTQILRDGQAQELPAAKALALLAYLAATHAPQPRERLLALLWPESPSDAARKNLRNLLWGIRKALGDLLYDAGADRIALQAQLWVDLWQLEAQLADVKRWIKAPAAGPPPLDLQLYRGPLIDGVMLADAPELEIWLLGERERLAQVYARTLGELVGAARSLANWRLLLSIGQHALAHDSLQEPIARALMEAHARLGERGDALRQYELLRAALERELGVPPLPETEALREAILSGAIRPDPPATPARSSMPGPQAAPPAPFIGRSAELTLLDQALHEAQSSARVVLISGEIGIGKSRLWQEWSRRLAGLPQPPLILSARCLSATRALPFAPLIELFGAPGILQELLSSQSQPAPLWLAELARLLPQLRSVQPDLPIPSNLAPDEERRRLFEALAQCVAALASRQLLLHLDDLHWADRATLDWLGYLLHRLSDRALLLLVSYRAEEAPGPLVQLAAHWARSGIARRIALRRLSADESTQLVQLLAGDVTRAKQLHTRSDGNPYFLIELCRTPGEDLPPALSELIRARLSALPEQPRHLLQIAAVLEHDFDFATLQRAAVLPESETLDALDTLLAAQILVEQGQRYQFGHPLLASVVQDGLSNARRAVLHRRAGEALAHFHAGNLAPIAGRLLIHALHAGETQAAARYARIAADHALALAAPVEAAAFYRQALSLDSDPALHMGLGMALFAQSELAAARNEYAIALSAYEERGNQAAAAQAELELAESALPAGRAEEVMQRAEHVLQLLGDQPDPGAQAHAHFLLGAGGLLSGRALAESEQHLARAAQLATEHNLPAIAGRSRFELGNLLAQRGDLSAARQAFRESIELARDSGEPFQEAIGYNNAAYHALLDGDLNDAREQLQQAMQIAERTDLRLLFQYLYSTRGEIALAEQQWDEAEDWFERGLAISEQHANKLQSANYRANLALAARGRGELDRALMLLLEARAAVAPLDAQHLRIQIELWLAETHLQRHERTAAREALQRAQTALRNSQRQALLAWAARLAAENAE